MTTTTPSIQAPIELAAPQHRRAAQAEVASGRIAAWAAIGLLIFVTLFPFYWMLRTALSTTKSLFADPPRCCRSTRRCAPSSGCSGLSTPEERSPRAAPAASINFLLVLRNSIIVLHADHGRPGLLLRAGRLRLRAAAAGRAGTRCSCLFLTALMVPPIFTAAAELRPDQEPRAAQHLPGHGRCRAC